MKRIISFIVFFLFLIACSKQERGDSSFVVKVNGSVLTRADLNANIPLDLSSEDSMIMAGHYIRMWINDKLMYDVASKKLADKKSIDRLVENYRQSLTIYQYKEQLISEKLSKGIDNQSLMTYYEENKDKFKLDRPLIKGLSLRIPRNAPQIDKIRVWYKTLTPANLTNIENYCVRNAVEYGYFDNWVDFNELTTDWPAYFRNNSEIIKSNKYLEQTGDKFCYFLNISDYSMPGDNAPFEYAKSTIKEMLINQQKIDFLKKIEDDLYRKALDKGQITFNE